MRRLGTLLAILFFTTTVIADKLETSGGQIIVGGPSTAAYYGPAFTYSLDGTELLLYVHGDHDITDGWATVDSVYLYTNPATWDGLTTLFTLRRTILPDRGQGHGADMLYGHPSVTTADSRYYLVAHKSPDAVIFHEQLWGYSTNGQDFTWNRLLRWVNSDTQRSPRPATQGIPSVTVLAASPSYFWGFIEVFDHLSFGTGLGMIRMRRAATPKGYDLVEIRSENEWRSVDEDGTFSFFPDIMWFGVSKPKIVWDGGQYYLWVAGAGPNNSCGPCPNAGTGWGNRFVYRSVDPNTTSLSSVVQNVASNVRCMPGGYDESRIFPMPISGNGLLYSATNEANWCLTGDPYRGSYIVVTAIQ